jgi:hypothetical protein
MEQVKKKKMSLSGLQVCFRLGLLGSGPCLFKVAKFMLVTQFCKALPLLLVAVLLQANGSVSRKPYPKHLEHISYWRDKLFDPEESDTFKLIYPGK